MLGINWKEAKTIFLLVVCSQFLLWAYFLIIIFLNPDHYIILMEPNMFILLPEIALYLVCGVLAILVTIKDS